MDGLRCWPDCLAIVTKSYAGNDGKAVRCIRLATEMELLAHWFEDQSGPVWVIDRKLKADNGERIALAFDHCLRPVTPPPATDTTTTDTPADALVGA
jgi:hypothetical protein